MRPFEGPSAESDTVPVSVLVVDPDLFFVARILSLLRTAGFAAAAVRTDEEAIRAVESAAPLLVIANLASMGAAALPLIARLKSLPAAPRILCYMSHTRIPEVREAVLTAGADRICANSAITMRLPEIVREVLNSPPQLSADDSRLANRMERVQ